MISGADSAGYGIFRILQEAGCRHMVVTDSKGAIYLGRRQEGNNNRYKQEMARKTNLNKLKGSLAQVIKETDIFIGVSGKGNLLNGEMVQSMNHNASSSLIVKG